MLRDKNQAQIFQLLYRSQNDPALHDDQAGERALFPSNTSGSSSQPSQGGKAFHLADLEDGVDFDSMRENEGEAAEFGIYYDDTNYDYMQHLRDIGDESGESQYVDAASAMVTGKGKGKNAAFRLEEAFQDVSMDDSSDPPSLIDSSIHSRSGKPRTYQNQQDVPDEIAGFKPDLDPRLREVLDALDDEAYVDDKDDDDIFGALVNDGKHGELDLTEFENSIDDEDEGWESDVTERALYQPKELKLSETIPEQLGQGHEESSTAVAEDGDWLEEFAKHKRGQVQKGPPKTADSIVAASAVQDKTPSLYTLNGTPIRHKKRKGARTNPSTYSMTSASLARREGQQLLDARFDQVEEMYALDEGDELDDDEDGGVSLASGLSKQSKMSTLSTTSFADKDAVRQDFHGMIDGFLADWKKDNPGAKGKGGKSKRGKNGNEVEGMRQLDELRRELGPARVHR